MSNPADRGALVRAAADLSKSVLAKHAADVDAKARFPEEGVKALADAGLLGLCLPTAHGGKGQAPEVFAAVVEELAQGCGSTAMIYVMHVTAAQAIASSTTLAGQEKLLAELASGRHLTTLAFSEKGSRSNFWAPVSKLEEKGEGYETNAFKSWVTSANRADSYVSSAQKPGAASPMESTVYLARRKSSGVRVAGGFDGLGLRGNDSAPVSIEGLEVAKGDLISAPGAGADTMLGVVLPWFSLGTSAMALGLCRASIAATVAHLGGAKLEHAGQALRDLPNLRERVARMAVKTEAASALVYRTAAELASPTPMTPLHVLMMRASSLETAVEVTDLAMRACGGAAFSKDLPVERLFRDARAGWVMAPTVDHLYEFAGRALTGLPLF